MSNPTRAATMTAIMQHAYGTPAVLREAQVPMPEPAATEVLVRVHAAGVDAGTWHLVTGRPYLMRIIGFGIRAPKNPVRGLAFAGRVTAVGSAVTRTHVGDDVFGSAEGAFAEYVVAPESAIVAMPRSLGYEKAAAMPISAVTALQAVRAAGVRNGQSVLVIGAAGGVGGFAVQLAADLGAVVTGVCSGPKAGLVRDLGASDVIDHTRADVTAESRHWDAIIDTAGSRRLSRLRRILAPAGALVIVGGQGGPLLDGIGRVVLAGLLNLFTEQKLLGLVSKENPADLSELAALVDEGRLDPAIDTVYPLSAAADAVTHIGTGRARGKVVLSI